jgi:flagellar hook assembly protein FlgD
VDGRLVRLLATGMAAAGSRDLVWDGRSNDGRAVAAGTYLVRLDADTGGVTQRVVRLR